MKRLLFAAAVLAVAGTCKAAGEGDKQVPPRTAKAPGIVYLERARGCELRAEKLREKGLLARELLRQSLLIAARDELGLLTRDFWQGEPMPEPGRGAPLDLAIRPGNPNRIEVFRGADQARQVVAELELALVAQDYYPNLVAAAERLSRTGFVQALQKAGFRGKPHAWKADAALSDEQRRLLEEMTFSSQYLALRQIHAAIRAGGESPELLAGLIRGYANLGLLTEVYLHPAHKVFKARALLYARRLGERKVRPQWSQYHRAYACALAGLHRWALEELEAADKQLRAAHDDTARHRPTWAPILDSYCRYRLEPLDEDKVAASDRQLYGLLEFTAAELSGSCDLAIATGLRVVRAMPECYRIHDGLCRFSGVALGHMATVVGLNLVGEKLYPRLAAAAGLPAGVREVVAQGAGGGLLVRLFGGGRKPAVQEEYKLRARLMATLLDAGRAEAPSPEKPQPGADAGADSTPPALDRAEFSWSVLGHLLRELALLQVLRRANFEHHWLSVSTAEFQAAAAPLVARHPYRPLIECLTSDVAARAKARERLSRLEPESLEFTAHNLWVELARSHPQRRIQWIRQAFAHLDGVARDQDLAMITYYEKPLWFAQKLIQASPASPLARVVFIREDWKNREPQAAAWEKESQPAVLQALGARYFGLSRWADAERCLEAAIRRVPAIQSFETLASVYEKQGNEEKWLATLERGLQEPDYGLCHAHLCQRIATHFMERCRWERALPYAVRAATSYSCMSLRCAGACYEGQQNWAEAERYFQAVARRYDSQQLRWYMFCRRTGHGDLEAAREFARNYAARRRDKTDYQGTREIGRFHLLEGDLAQALACFQASFAGTKDAQAGLGAALVADELKDVKARDEALRQVQSLGTGDKDHAASRSPTPIIALARWMAADLAADGRARLDPPQLDKWLAAGNSADRPLLLYCVGKYMQLRGRADEALKLWKQSVADRVVDGRLVMDSSSYTLAAAELLRRGIKPEDHKDAFRGAKAGNGK